MKRYYISALALCLVVPACAKHKGASADQTQKAAQADKSSEMARNYEEYAAESDHVPFPAHEDKNETASAQGTAVVPTTTSRAPSYGNPPGTYTAPGTTKAVTPSQGTMVPGQPPAPTAATSGAAANADQGTSESDRGTTQRIRRAVVDDDALSFTAKNVQITTQNGDITLRGLVMTEEERWEIERIARSYAGSGKVDNLIELQSPAPMKLYE